MRGVGRNAGADDRVLAVPVLWDNWFEWMAYGRAPGRGVVDRPDRGRIDRMGLLATLVPSSIVGRTV